MSAGHQPVRAERVGSIGGGAEARGQQSSSGGEATAKPDGNR